MTTLADLVSPLMGLPPGSVVITPRSAAALTTLIRLALPEARGAGISVPAWLDDDLLSLEQAGLAYLARHVDTVDSDAPENRQQLSTGRKMLDMSDETVVGCRAAGAIAGVSHAEVANRARSGELAHDVDGAGRFTFRRADLEALRA
ncbi:MAG TPA: hypothetical protein VMD59_02075 [Acidimicrobiales bacterium]|nr:hypothetical protein [Acidimicrobiales bacterium]